MGKSFRKKKKNKDNEADKFTGDCKNSNTKVELPSNLFSYLIEVAQVTKELFSDYNSVRFYKEPHDISLQPMKIT